MKFYDKTGKQHNSYLGAMINDITNKAKNAVEKKIPGFKEASEIYNPMQDFQVPEYPEDDEDDDESESDDEEDDLQEESEYPDYSEISIDYAHKRVILKDADGNIVASHISDNLTRNTIDSALMDVLYPDGNIPEHIFTDIQSQSNRKVIYTCRCKHERCDYPVADLCKLCYTQINRPVYEDEDENEDDSDESSG